MTNVLSSTVIKVFYSPRPPAPELSYVSIRIDGNTTAEDLLGTLAKHRMLGSFSWMSHARLFLFGTVNSDIFERSVDDDEVPFDIVASTVHTGSSESLRIIVRPQEEERAVSPPETSIVQTYNLKSASRFGYCDKLESRGGAVHTYWFVCQRHTLYQYKSHAHKAAVDQVSLSHAEIRWSRRDEGSFGGAVRSEFEHNLFEVEIIRTKTIWVLQFHSYWNALHWMEDLRKQSSLVPENSQFLQIQQEIEDIELAKDT